MLDPKLCVKCKGKLLCGLSYCPVLERHSARSRATSRIKGTDFYGSSPPGIFISWHNYPNITVSALSPTTVEPNAAILDAPEQWFGLSDQDILSFRESLIGSGKKFKAKEASLPDQKLSTMQELVMSFKPVNVEESLFKKPEPILSFHESVAPIGPRAPLKSIKLTENPKIPQKVDYLNADINVKSMTAVMELYDSGFPISFLYKLLSAGTLGVEKNRKLVPTRWAISAIDSNISEKIIDTKVKSFQQLGEIRLFHSTYLDNTFYVLLLPREWSFEQLECWLPGGAWTADAKEHSIIQDHEFYEGRKDYASNVEGAYYSARLAVAEYLVKEKRQAAALVFREIGQGYNMPLGVWVIRETVRKALESKPFVFFDLQLALKFLGMKLKVPVAQYEKESKLLDQIRHQKRLGDF
ncbi:MAG: Nre family DNA repair protein [Candidatus Diapherotrites archaeon]|nr:Nre family DNA repair protein [Candidatus Diapherotrites archaeon]